MKLSIEDQYRATVEKIFTEMGIPRDKVWSLIDEVRQKLPRDSFGDDGTMYDVVDYVRDAIAAGKLEICT